MAVTNTAAFGQVPNIGQAILTAAKAAPLSGATDAVLLFTAGANGSIINGINAIPRNTIASAALLAIYYSSDAGTTLNVLSVGTLAVYTFATTLAPTPLNFTNLNGSIISVTNPLYVPAGETLYASSAVALANGILVTANGIDL